MESIMAKVWIWIISLVPAAIGSGLSLFLGKDTKQLSYFVILSTFLFGIGLAHLLGGAAIEYWHIDPLSYIASSIQVSIGFMGMAILAELKLQLPVMISAIRKKFIGE